MRIYEHRCTNAAPGKELRDDCTVEGTEVYKDKWYCHDCAIREKALALISRPLAPGELMRITSFCGYKRNYTTIEATEKEVQNYLATNKIGFTVEAEGKWNTLDESKVEEIIRQIVALVRLCHTSSSNFPNSMVMYEALNKIASCKSIVDGDVIDIARKALNSLEGK